MDGPLDERAIGDYREDLNRALAETGAPADLASRVNVSPITNTDDLTTGLRKPAIACVEIGVAPRSAAKIVAARASDDAITAVLTARSAYRVPIAACMVEALRSRISIEGDDQIEIALHEALANAILHGSLEIGDRRPGAPFGFETYASALTEALDDPRRGQRPVAMSLIWTEDTIKAIVQDHGRGHQTSNEGGDSGHFGRGLSIIAALSAEVRLRAHGRRIDMVFERNGKPNG